MSPINSRSESTEARASLDLSTALWTSWLLGLALAVGGGILVAGAVASGAQPWLLVTFLVAVAVAAIGHYRLVHRSTGPEPRAAVSDVAAALASLGAGELPGAFILAASAPGRLRQAFHGASRELAVFARQLQDGAIQLAGNTERVAAISTALATSAAQQSASVVEVTAAMEELCQTAEQIASRAASQAELAVRAETVGQSGGASVEGALAGLAFLRGHIGEMSVRADELGTSAKEVFRVLDLVAEIAQETHILSLNAAIEAAMAGPKGARFSVVADEVRRLAQQTRDSTTSVRALLDELAGAIRSVVVATEEGSKELNGVLDRASAGALAIAELRTTMTQTASIATEISAVTRQQTAATQEALLTLRDLSQVVQVMSGDLQSLSRTSRELNRFCSERQLAAQTFHVESPRSVKHVAYSWLAALRALPRDEHPAALRKLMAEAPFTQLGFIHDGVGVSVCSLVRDRATGDLQEVDGRGVSIVHRVWYRNLQHERRAVVSDAYRSLVGGGLCFTVAVPWIDQEGRVIAAVGFDVDTAEWTRI